MRLDPPLDPTAEQARAWLTAELAQGEYDSHETLWHRLTSWISGVLDRLFTADSGPGGSVAGVPVWLIAAAVLLGALFLISRSVGFGRGHGRGTSRVDGVLDGDTRTAREHRQQATRAFAAGDYDEAVLAAYRAVARAAVERTVLDDRPGRTAHEVAIGLAPAFPDFAGDALIASRAFDSVRYGHLRATRESATQVMETDQRIAAARPIFAPLPAATS